MKWMNDMNGWMSEELVVERLRERETERERDRERERLPGAKGREGKGRIELAMDVELIEGVSAVNYSFLKKEGGGLRGIVKTVR